jgi:peptidoglycan/xylan/chitin deacetylase (PgdA/CDA1 family)
MHVLSECGADLGIALETRAVDASASAILRRGCITLQEGILSEYGEAPPGFWELYEGALSAEVSVRLSETGSSVGDVIARSAVTIQKSETPESLLEKLHEEGSRVLASAVALIRDGKAVPLSEEFVESRLRSEPTREDVILLQKRLPHWRRNGDVSTIVRNLYVLFVYYSGLYFLVRQWHRLFRSRAAIVLYHRVNDYSKDVLTVDCRTFAAQLLAISQRYFFSSTAEMVDHIRAGEPLRPTTVAIHFDDCYRDILINGAPIMSVCGVPACAFINSGFVDTSRTFAHDAASPFTYEMLRSSDVRTWINMGFEVGAHTINHVDLGTYPIEKAGHEIVQCGTDLEKMIGKPVDLFSFPFGRPENIRTETMQIIQTTSYIANFSAHGGFIGSRTDPYDIPRAGAHYESSPVYCLLQIEGLTLSRLARKFRSAWSRPARVATQP